MSTDRRQKLLSIVGLLLVIGISIVIFIFRDQAAGLANYGYFGIFVLSILANATLILPAPGILIVFTMGSVFNPIGVALAASAGSALGELSGYLAGMSGQVVVENTKLYRRILEWMRMHQSISFLMIFVLAAVPNPVFDIAGIAAGALRFPIGAFLFWVWLGKLLKMMFFAFAGYFSIDWIFPW